MSTVRLLLMNVNILDHDPMLPVGDKPFWDTNVSPEELGDLQSVADSHVLWKSLKQSRERWLFQTFPKFHSKGRGNKTTLDIPHNTRLLRGRCDLEIGPHIFEGTTFYEAQYPCPPIPNTTSVHNPSSTSQWHSNAPTGFHLTPLSSVKPSTIDLTTPVAQPIATFTPLIPSIADSSVPQALVTQLNLAASTNPTLYNLLQRAAARTATMDELETLSLFVQSLASMPAESSLAASNPTTIAQPPPAQPHPILNANQPPPTPLPVKQFDLVLEFRETSNDRWLIPRSCHPVASRSGSDVNLTMCLSGTGETPSVPSKSENTETELQQVADLPVSFLIKDVPEELWDTIVRWIGGEETMKINREYQESMVHPKRLYLGLQISPGPLLTQLQTSTTPQYNLKLLKQGPTAPSRRAPRQKTTHSRVRSSNAGGTSSEPPPGGVVKKRSRASTAKPAPPPIHCILCKQTDVPLILGGRFCRPCVESGNYKTSMVQAPIPGPTAEK